MSVNIAQSMKRVIQIIVKAAADTKVYLLFRKSRVGKFEIDIHYGGHFVIIVIHAQISGDCRRLQTAPDYSYFLHLQSSFSKVKYLIRRQI